MIRKIKLKILLHFNLKDVTYSNSDYTVKEFAMANSYVRINDKRTRNFKCLVMFDINY